MGPRLRLAAPSRGTRLRGAPFAAALAFGVLLSRGAFAFEREWHLGGGVGVVSPSSGYSDGGALSLHGAYGLSDVFDARLTFTTSLHDPDAEGATRTALTLTTLGLAYKLDIIEWVPYFGVRAGYFRFGSAPRAPYSAGGGALGAMAGIDYSFSRSFAVGAEIAYDLLLPEGNLWSGLLHAEYRWGY